MWKRLVPGLGMAASLVLAAGCASSALPPGASSPAPVRQSGVSSAPATSSAVSAPAHPGGAPQLKLRPASGPAGTHVTISGQLNPGQVRADGPYFRHPAYFNLITDVWADCATAPHAYPYDCSAGPASLAGCELIVGLIHPLINLDTATGRVTGSLTVGGEGTCFQDRPTGHPQATLPGRYVLAIGAHATSWALFEVTGSPAPTSASTAPVEVHVASLPRPSRGLRRDAVLTTTGTGHAEPSVVFHTARDRANLRDRVPAWPGLVSAGSEIRHLPGIPGQRGRRRDHDRTVNQFAGHCVPIRR
jgi:hypothetical protein